MAAGNAHDEQTDVDRATAESAPETQATEQVPTPEAAAPARSHAKESAPRRRKPGRSATEIAGKVVGFLASVIRWIGLIFALILVVHVVLTIGGANPNNGITEFVRDAANQLALGFRDLFTPDDQKLRVLVNFGIAAIFWLAVSAILARIVRTIGGRSASE